MKIVAVSSMLRNTNALKALGEEMARRHHQFFLISTTAKDDAHVQLLIQSRIPEADVVMVGLGSANAPWQLEVEAFKKIRDTGKKIVLITDWPGSIKARTEGRFTAEDLAFVSGAIVPLGDEVLAKVVCPNTYVCATHHPDIEGAEIAAVPRGEIRKVLGWGDDFIVLITGTKTRAVNEEVLGIVKQAYPKLPSNVRFIFLVHPGERDVEPLYYNKKFLIEEILPNKEGREMSAETLLAGADAFLNIASNAVSRAGFLRIRTLWALTPAVKALLQRNSGVEVPAECDGQYPSAIPIFGSEDLTVLVPDIVAGRLGTILRRRLEEKYPTPTPPRGSAVEKMADFLIYRVRGLSAPDSD